MKSEHGFATRAIHCGYNALRNEGALTPPLHLTSTFVFETAEAGGEQFAGRREGHVYSRISNPTCDLLEKRIASLEGAEVGLALASGMGAITATLWSLLKPGDELITDKTLYGCTYAFLQQGLAKWGVTITHIDLSDPANLSSAISEKTRVVYFETPANPNMRIVDIAAVSAISHDAGSVVVVDNTYATPYLTRPISLGADLVVHSATKYLGGHGDVVAGLVAGSAEAIHDIRMTGMKDMTGAVMAPFNAMLVLRGMKTLSLRMERHCSSAQIVAEWLEQHSAIGRVYYPGLESFSKHDLAKRQMALPGAMIAFELEGGRQAGVDFMNELKLINRAVSLGDTETLIQHPASMTHSTYSLEERASHFIGEGLLRLSIGLEDVTDIIFDLEKALAISEVALSA